MRKPLLLSAAAVSLATASPASGQNFNLPDGPAKDTVAALCGACHPVNRLGAGYTPGGWHTVMRMMENFGAPIPKDQVETVTNYLIKSFPERSRPAAAIIDGPAQASIKEWPAFTPGSRPHDPMAARDGSIWYTGQLANALARLDPKTGQIKEYPMKSPQTAPHGLAEDGAGNIWFTGNFLGLMGKLDPKTGEVTEYKLPDPTARDPHSLAFDQNGILWFTVQQGNFVGRLDPKTGDIKLVTMPKPRSQPYGMVMASDGTFYFDEFGANRIAHIDPKTMAINEFNLPNADSRPRRISITSDDMMWYGDYSRGFLGRLNPKTGEVKEWPSPSGPQSQPYGIVTVNDVIWYNESVIWPNTIVRFDPKTEKFQSWLIPGGGGVVRNMSVMPNGNIAMAESGVNRVALVEIGGSKNGTK